MELVELMGRKEGDKRGRSHMGKRREGEEGREGGGGGECAPECGEGGGGTGGVREEGCVRVLDCRSVNQTY